MKAILVDDDLLTLKYLTRLLKEYEGLNIIGTYTDAFVARTTILKEKPSIVFLDIEMPKLNGIELAEQLQQLLPNIQIVFVTSFENYAVKAFELNATDYLVKPVQQSRLKETLRRLHIRQENNTHPSNLSDSVNQICTFGSLSFTRTMNTTKTLEVRWRTSKARGVFIFLLLHRSGYVNKNRLLEVFWPEFDREKGLTQLYSTIYHIRKTLSTIQFPITITNQEDSYRLDLHDVLLDIDEWENNLLAHSKLNEKSLSINRELLGIYQGDFLSGEDHIWAETERMRLRALWLERLSKVADYLFEQGEYGESISLFLQMQHAVPYIEYSYVRLMEIFATVRNLNAVEQQYTKLKKMLWEDYSAEPKPAIKEWYANWLKHVEIEDSFEAVPKKNLTKQDYLS